MGDPEGSLEWTPCSLSSCFYHLLARFTVASSPPPDRCPVWPNATEAKVTWQHPEPWIHSTIPDCILHLPATLPHVACVGSAGRHCLHVQRALFSLHPHSVANPTLQFTCTSVAGVSCCLVWGPLTVSPKVGGSRGRSLVARLCQRSTGRGLGELCQGLPPPAVPLLEAMLWAPLLSRCLQLCPRPGCGERPLSPGPRQGVAGGDSSWGPLVCGLSSLSGGGLCFPAGLHCVSCTGPVCGRAARTCMLRAGARSPARCCEATLSGLPFCVLSLVVDLWTSL